MTARENYLDQLLVSLRARDVPGEQIRDVLDEVQAHLDDSGEDPLEAFGPPQRYAEELAGRPGGARHRRATLRGTLDGLLLTAGAVLLMEAVVALIAGAPVTVTVGTLVLLAVVAASGVVVAPMATAMLDGRRSAWWVLGAFAVLWTGAVVAATRLRTGLLTLPLWSAVVVGVVLLGAGVVRTRRSTDPLPASRLAGERPR